MSDFPVEPVPAAGDAAAAEAGQPSESPGPAKSRARLTGAVLIQAITQGSSAVITILAIFLALVVGGVLIVFSDPVVSRAWSSFFAAPGYALGADLGRGLLRLLPDVRRRDPEPVDGQRRIPRRLCRGHLLSALSRPAPRRRR